MSVAVAQMPTTFPEPQAAVQQDASNQLLEALLASCRQPTRSQQLTGFGRELVPYFVAEKTSAPRSKGNRSNTTSPRRINRSKATAMAAAMVAAAKKNTKSSTAKQSPPKSRAVVEDSRASQFAALMSSWAGPGFCVSPSPEKLPTPSIALLG